MARQMLEVDCSNCGHLHGAHLNVWGPCRVSECDCRGYVQPNPFCENPSSAGDACGACAGCFAEVARLHVEGNR